MRFGEPYFLILTFTSLVRFSEMACYLLIQLLFILGAAGEPPSGPASQIQRVRLGLTGRFIRVKRLSIERS